MFVIILRPYYRIRGSARSRSFVGETRLAAGPGEMFLCLSSLEEMSGLVRNAPSVLRVGRAITIIGLLKSLRSRCEVDMA